MLKASLVLLAIFGIAAAVPINKKVDGILKNVGKRYMVQNPQLLRMMIDRNLTENWMNEPADFVMPIKHQIAERIVFHIRWQTSSRTKDNEEHGKVLLALLDDDVTVELCNSKTLNKVQFASYLYSERMNYRFGKEDAPYSYIVESTGNDVLKMIATVELVDNNDVKSSLVWEITAKLTTEGDQSFYKINHIKVGGGCITQGKVDHEFTEIGTEKEALEKLSKETNPDVQTLFNLFTPRYLAFKEQHPDRIPFVWLQGLQGGSRAYSVCIAGESERNLLNEEEFRSWYTRFSLMWHPKKGDQDYITVQMIKVEEKELTARITMKLEIGLEKPESYDWNFIVVATIEDDQWEVSKVDVPCDPTLSLMDKSLPAIREIVYKSFVDNFQRTPPPVPNHKSIEFLKQFISNNYVDQQYCDEEYTSDSVDKLEVSFFTAYKNYDIQLSKYFFEAPEITLPAPETAEFALKTLSTDKSDPPIRYENTWTFSLKWKKDDQFYYIDKVVISCFKAMKKDYKQFINFSWAGGK